MVDVDPELVELVEKAVNEGLTAASWFVIVIGFVAVGVGAFMGSYFRKKGENAATREDFSNLITQLKEQTQATEGIKAEIQHELNAFSNTLERKREFVGFRRDQVAKHLGIVLKAYIDIYSISQMIPLRLWLASNKDLETEERFRTSMTELRVHFAALKCLGVIPHEVCKEFKSKEWNVRYKWDGVLGQATYRTPEFKEEFPEGMEFSGERYGEKWTDFMRAIEDLGEVVEILSREIRLPI